MIDSRFFHTMGPQTLGHILQLTQSTLHHKVDLALTINDVAPLDRAREGDMACYHNPKYKQDLMHTKAGFCFVKADDVKHVPPTCLALITPTPYRAFALVAHAFYPHANKNYKSSNVLIDPTATIGPNCIIEANVVIQDQAVLEKDVMIGANAVIGKGVIIGEGTIIEAGAVLTHSIVGKNCVIGTGARLGQAGFGFYMDEKGHVTVPQLGRVLIGDNVEIGANTTIDRGTLKDTIVGEGCRLDNLVQLGHNVELGRGCVIVAQVGIAGSTILGDYVIAAGQAGIAGHLHIEDRVRIAAQSGIMRDIKAGETVAGSPAVPVKEWHRQTIALKNLIKTRKAT